MLGGLGREFGRKSASHVVVLAARELANTHAVEYTGHVGPYRPAQWQHLRVTIQRNQGPSTRTGLWNPAAAGSFIGLGKRTRPSSARQDAADRREPSQRIGLAQPGPVPRFQQIVRIRRPTHVDRQSDHRKRQSSSSCPTLAEPASAVAAVVACVHAVCPLLWARSTAFNLWLAHAKCWSPQTASIGSAETEAESGN